MGRTTKVVLTGGPCAGKTTALARVTERFEGMGWKVFRVPEAATLLIQGGMDPSAGGADAVAFQSAILSVQFALEDAMCAAAARHERALVLCDRGAMDSRAYVLPGVWQAVLDELRLSEVGLRDARYDAVVHMVTAAAGAEEHYGWDNPARSETPERARALDRMTHDAWVGHPHLRVVANGHGGFEAKLADVVRAIARAAGIPEPLEAERKFLASSVDEAALAAVRSETVEIEQTYLVDGSRVRRRGKAGAFVYTHTRKSPGPRDGQRVEVERMVGPREYLALLAERDAGRDSVVKTRTCFTWEGRYFELDRFSAPAHAAGLVLLEVEHDPDEDPSSISLPPFVRVERDVTCDPAWSNSAIAAGRSLAGA